MNNRVRSVAFAARLLTATMSLASSAVESAVPNAESQRSLSLRYPAVPLIACDPYFSIWSQDDTLAGSDTTHWTGKPHRLTGSIRIDGNRFRVIGREPSDLPALPQTRVEVLPTRTIYVFEGQGIRLTLTFMTPALPHDLDILARPVTYVIWNMQSIDTVEHTVGLEFEADAEIAVNDRDQETVRTVMRVGDLEVAKFGTVEQPVLQKRGDDLRIDWGYLYVARPDKFGADFRVGPAGTERWLILAYDDEYSIQYMKRNLRPYWRRNGDDAVVLLKKSAAEFESLKIRCEQFDAELMKDLRAAGGDKYAAIAALAYRQCFAAGKFAADANGRPLQFSKENHSNGCIGTSDVFYPMSPQFLLFGPTLAKSFLVPFMNYAASDRWKFPFAPHDLGTYPHANGQVYGGGERSEDNQMPVEESGNLLILMAAVAHMEGNADFAGLYWKQLTLWAEYLRAKGFDPENQLCTDDFAGHLAHNVNLSAKAIIGLGSYALLCEKRGDKAMAEQYLRVAKEFAARWVKEADDGDHFRLAFDRPGTWSQKYNLVWDRLLGLNLFDPAVGRKEMDHYRKIQNRYGLPLDNRRDYTKLDWIVWSATLTRERGDFEALIDPVFAFLNQTPNRSPMTDWYDTKTASKVGFTARPVVGAVLMPLLFDSATWKKWAGRDLTRAAGWAAIPRPPLMTTLVPAADTQPARWRYTTSKPHDGWAAPDFDDSNWKEGTGGFGTQGTPGAVVGTRWDTPEIWLRRTVELPQTKPDNLEVWLHHDEDAVIYFNGVVATRPNVGYSTDYFSRPITPAGLSALKPGRNVIAVHCRQTGGGQFIDVGLVRIDSN